MLFGLGAALGGCSEEAGGFLLSYFFSSSSWLY